MLSGPGRIAVTSVAVAVTASTCRRSKSASSDGTTRAAGVVAGVHAAAGVKLMK
jgi:hypothetical protein